VANGQNNIEDLEQLLQKTDEEFEQFAINLSDEILLSLMDELNPFLFEFAYNLVLDKEKAEEILKESWDELLMNLNDRNIFNNHLLYTMYLYIIERTKY
jgi:hypothetical protein